MKFYRDKKNNIYYWSKIEANKLTAIHSDYSVSFFKNGKRHNSKNTACVYYFVIKEFFLNGKRYGYENDFTKKSWRKFVKIQAFL